MTGFALRVATDLATSVTKEAERNRIKHTALKAEKVTTVAVEEVMMRCLQSQNFKWWSWSFNDNPAAYRTFSSWHLTYVQFCKAYFLCNFFSSVLSLVCVSIAAIMRNLVSEKLTVQSNRSKTNSLEGSKRVCQVHFNTTPYQRVKEASWCNADSRQSHIHATCRRSVMRTLVNFWGWWTRASQQFRLRADGRRSVGDLWKILDSQLFQSRQESVFSISTSMS